MMMEEEEGEVFHSSSVAFASSPSDSEEEEEEGEGLVGATPTRPTLRYLMLYENYICPARFHHILLP
jgi:hypothetical protein